MILLGECELDYPLITQFTVYYKKKLIGTYSKSEMLRKFGHRYLDYAHENGIRDVEIYLI
jgi:hypothetical protein